MRVIRSSAYPMMTPIVPPVANLTDVNGVLITLDCEVNVDRLRHTRRDRKLTCRARVVGIGDGGLPGREIVRIRPHGSTYIEGASPKDCEVHVFDEHAWVRAEEAAARYCADRGYDLALCMFGGVYFERFQQYAINYYAGYIETNPTQF